MPKSEQFHKNKAIQIALDLFWLNGFKGTSLSDLTHAIGIGKGSFYNTFKSKRALFEQCIDVFKENSVNNLRGKLRAEKDVKKGLQNYLLLTLEDAVNDQKHRGCFMTNISAEMGASDEEIGKMMNIYYAEMKAIISDYLKNGSDLPSENINEITNTIITFFIGMTVQVKLQSDKAQIEQSIYRLIQTLF